MDNAQKTMEKIVALCKGRGFVYPGSEIYGGLANTWDYGPLGMALKNNIKQAWLKKFVQEKGKKYFVISPHDEFENIFGRPADKRRKLYNGMIKCQLFMYFR